jgi:hypothetical protein
MRKDATSKLKFISMLYNAKVVYGTKKPTSATIIEDIDKKEIKLKNLSCCLGL